MSRVDRASLQVAASPKAIFAAFADPASLMAWLPPDGMIGRALAYDFRPGGRYRVELSYAGEGTGKSTAKSDISSGRFLALDAGHRIVMSVEFVSDDPAFAGEMIMTWTFAPTAGGTDVTVAAERVPRGISTVDHQAGLTSSLANLARFVTNR